MHIHYRPLQGHDIAAASHLAAGVFCEDVAPLFEPEGVAEFLQFLAPVEMARRLHHESFAIVALLEHHLVGMIEIRDYDHISLLFVEKAFQGRQIGTRLVELAIAECKRRNPTLSEISVSATTNAVPFYKRVGFYTSEAEKLDLGMRYTPMVLDIGGR